MEAGGGGGGGGGRVRGLRVVLIFVHFSSYGVSGISGISYRRSAILAMFDSSLTQKKSKKPVFSIFLQNIGRHAKLFPRKFLISCRFCHMGTQLTIETLFSVKGTNECCAASTKDK